MDRSLGKVSFRAANEQLRKGQRAISIPRHDDFRRKRFISRIIFVDWRIARKYEVIPVLKGYVCRNIALYGPNLSLLWEEVLRYSLKCIGAKRYNS